MGKIRHCHGYRKAQTFWLYPKDRRFQYQVLHVLNTCPTCHQQVMEWEGVDFELQKSQRQRIKLNEHQAWLARINTDLAFREETVTQYKNMVAHAYVSDCTREMSRDTARVYEKNIRRFSR